MRLNKSKCKILHLRRNTSKYQWDPGMHREEHGQQVRVRILPLGLREAHPEWSVQFWASHDRTDKELMEMVQCRPQRC